MRFKQTESVLQTKNQSGPAKNRFSVALPCGICFMFDMMIDAGPKFYVVRSPSPYMTLRSSSWT